MSVIACDKIWKTNFTAILTFISKIYSTQEVFIFIRFHWDERCLWKMSYEDNSKRNEHTNHNKERNTFLVKKQSPFILIIMQVFWLPVEQREMQQECQNKPKWYKSNELPGSGIEESCSESNTFCFIKLAQDINIIGWSFPHNNL